MALSEKIKSMFSGKKKFVTIAIVGAAAYLLLRGKGAAAAGAGGDVQLGMQPAPINPGEAVSAQSYRIIADRRAGMDYTPAQQDGDGIKFSFPTGGVFTRNFVQENGTLMAEIARN